MKYFFLFLSAIIVPPAANAGAETAAASSAFMYQGQLKHAGIPVNEAAAFEFTLWDAEVDGRQVAEGIRAELVVQNGLFNVELDFGPDLFHGEPRWLEISVRTSFDSARLTPRQPIKPAPLALYALNAPGGEPTPWQINGSDIYYTNGNVGVGTDTPQHPLHAEVQTELGRSIYGLATSSANAGIGVFGESENGTGKGVIGYASSPAGVNFAVVGQTESENGYAGYFSGGSNYFEGDTGFGTLEPQYPVHAILNESSGRAIYGLSPAVASNGAGVYGEAEGSRGRALVGNASGTSGTNFGLVASTASPIGYAGYFLGGRNYFQGRVGIGEQNPQSALDVNGEVLANSFLYSTPKEKKLTVGGYAFQPASSSTTYNYSDGLWATAPVTSASFVAPIVLPQDVTVTSMTVYFYDVSTTANMTVLLRYYPFDNVADTMTEVTYYGSGGYVNVTNSSVSPNVIDNHSNTYYIVASCDDWPGATLRLKAVVITYTVYEAD